MLMMLIDLCTSSTLESAHGAANAQETPNSNKAGALSSAVAIWSVDALGCPNYFYNLLFFNCIITATNAITRSFQVKYEQS